MMCAEMPSRPSSKIWNKPHGPAPMITVSAVIGAAARSAGVNAMCSDMVRTCPGRFRGQKGAELYRKTLARLPHGARGRRDLRLPAELRRLEARMSTLLWFRLDLRLEDNPALEAALEAGAPVVPVYLWCPREEGAWAPGAASRWWLHESLERLAEALERCGSRLIVRAGDQAEVTLRELARECGATRLYWNRRYE